MDLPSENASAIEGWLNQIEAQGDGPPRSHAEGDAFFFRDGQWQRDEALGEASKSNSESEVDLTEKAAERLANHAQRFISGGLY